MLSVENNHNVYVLGAGFSRSAGLPLMNNFLHVMRDAHPWLVTQQRNTEAIAIESVLKFRLDSASAAYRVPLEVENIEHLFSLASATNSSELSDALPLAISATLDYAAAQSRPVAITVNYAGPTPAQLPKDWALKPSPGASPATISMPGYDFLVGQLIGYFQPVQTKNTIITFNYDLLVEESLERLGRTVAYGFSQGVANYDSSASALVAQNSPDSIPLLKLHGSMNWGYRGGRGRSFTVYGSYAALSAAKASPELVPPTWRKLFGGPLNHVWDAAVQAIEGATRLVIIGFSIPDTDLHFRYLLAAGLMNNISLREVLLVTPDAESEMMQARLVNLLRPGVGATPIAQRAGEFLCSADARSTLARDVLAPWSRGAGAPQGY